MKQKLISTVYVIILLFVTALSTTAQHEIKVYGGLGDFPGVAYEYSLKSNRTIELATAMRFHNRFQILLASELLDQRTSNFFLDVYTKRYRNNPTKSWNFYTGAYLRLWRKSEKVTEALSPAQQMYIDTSNIQIDITAATGTNKISGGFLLGSKRQLGEHLTFGFNTGIGFALPATFFKTITYTGDILPTHTGRIGPDGFFWYLNHLSIIGQISLGYQFGSDNKKDEQVNFLLVVD